MHMYVKIVTLGHMMAYFGLYKVIIFSKYNNYVVYSTLDIFTAVICNRTSNHKV